MAFDFEPLVPADAPAPAAKWKGLARYHFIGGNNDPDGVPVADLTAAAQAVLAREGRDLATYGLNSGPQGYKPLREFLAKKLARDAGIKTSFDDILLVSGSLQALDLVNGALLARGDTVICERDCYEGTLNRYKRLGVNVVAIPLDTGRHEDGCAGGRALRAQGQGRCGRSSSTPSRPCRTQPARS